MHTLRRVTLAAAVALAGCASQRAANGTSPATVAPAGAVAGVAANRAAFQKLLAEQWDDAMTRRPEMASLLGDLRFNDRSQDLSATAVTAELERDRGFLARFEAIDPAGFGDQEALTHTLMLKALREELADARFEDWKMPVTQFHGIHLEAPLLASRFPFRTARHYDDYAKRLRALPRQLDDTIANMRLGMQAGLMPPRYLLEKVSIQARRVASTRPEDSTFAGPLARFPEDVPAADRQRIQTEVLAALRDAVLPAYDRFARFVETEYAPRGRTQPGIWALPAGAERYARATQRWTTTDRTPEEVHEIGLREVARIEREMLAIARKLGSPDLKHFAHAIETDARLHPASADQLVDAYRRYVEGMKPELPRLFGTLPRADLTVVAMEKFRDKEGAAAEYMLPALDGSRPGQIVVNTSDFAKRTTIDQEATAYHEGVPGHHLQLALQAEIAGVPNQRKIPGPGSGAFIEGWALYAESLGKEMGRYQDPYSDYGRLQNEIWRAVRLVVDTGVHAKRWTREQMVEFFRQHANVADVDVQAEVDRYIAWPGQALAYKTGELEILRLREKARQALGPRFDIRRFHDTVLGAGALPLDVLAARVDRWIATERAR